MRIDLRTKYSWDIRTSCRYWCVLCRPKRSAPSPRRDGSRIARPCGTGTVLTRPVALGRADAAMPRAGSNSLKCGSPSSHNFIRKITTCRSRADRFARPKRPTDPVLSLFCDMQRICRVVELDRHFQRGRFGAMLRALQVGRQICRSAYYYLDR